MNADRAGDRYLDADDAVAAHLAICAECPNHGCEVGLELLRVESAAWSAFVAADPVAAAAYRKARMPR